MEIDPNIFGGGAEVQIADDGPAGGRPDEVIDFAEKFPESGQSLRSAESEVSVTAEFVPEPEQERR